MNKKPKVTITCPNVLNAFVPFLVFYILKLSGVIAWSWIWVTSPLWIYLFWCIGYVLLGYIMYKVAKEISECQQ